MVTRIPASGFPVEVGAGELLFPNDMVLWDGWRRPAHMFTWIPGQSSSLDDAPAMAPPVAAPESTKGDKMPEENSRKLKAAPDVQDNPEPSAVDESASKRQRVIPRTLSANRPVLY